MSDDYCVYARNILGRLTEITTNTGFSSDITNQSPEMNSPGINSSFMVMAAMFMVFIAMGFLRGSSRAESKVESS